MTITCFVTSLIISLFIAESFRSSHFAGRSSTHHFSNSGKDGDLDAPFLKALIAKSNSIPGERFFFPGHAGGQQGLSDMMPMYNVLGSHVWKLDLPELDGLGNLHSPDDAILEALQLASNLYESQMTWFLINGSTSGILIAVMAVVRLHLRRSKGKKRRSVLLLGRDSHKSAFDAITIAGCDAVLLPCHIDDVFGVAIAVDLEAVTGILREYGDRVCGVLLTRPTYQGLAYNSETLSRFADLCHSHDIPLIVDEAHGSHLRFMQQPEIRDALDCGADLVVQSTHKTLSSLTQTGMLHLGRDAFGFNTNISNNRKTVTDIVHECYSMLTSTSPSALLLASLDASRAYMASSVGRQAALTASQAALELRLTLRAAAATMPCSVRLLDDSPAVRALGLVVDPLRLSVRFEGHRNAVLIDDAMCEDDGIYCELNLPQCITYAIPIGSSPQSLSKLRSSLVEQTVGTWETQSNDQQIFMNAASLIVSPPVTAEYTTINVFEPLQLEEAIAAETISPYPPGVPVLIRGEKITQLHLEILKSLAKSLDNNSEGLLGSGRTVTGASDPKLHTLQIYESEAITS